MSEIQSTFDDRSLVLKIAEINVKIRADAPSLIRALKSQYSNFISKENRRDLILEIELRENYHIPNPDGSSNFYNHQTFQGNQCFVQSNHFTGFVDTGKKTGKITVIAEQPLSWLEHFLRIAFAVIALDHNALLFHGAGIIKQGKGHIFFGPSGSGKSTVTGFSGEATILGDDLVVIRRMNERYMMFAAPFNGNLAGFHLVNSSGPICGFYRLIQNKTTFIKKMGAGIALSELVASVPPVNRNRTGSLKVLDFFQSMLRQVPCFELNFRRDNTFWRYVSGKPETISCKKSADCIACG